MGGEGEGALIGKLVKRMSKTYNMRGTFVQLR